MCTSGEPYQDAVDFKEEGFFLLFMILQSSKREVACLHCATGAYVSLRK
jgi:hypothetical protein